MSRGHRVFFDTNVLVYRFDADNDKKRNVVGKLIEKHYSAESGVISTQVIQEFINVCTSKFKPSYSSEQIDKIIDDLLEPLCQQVPNTTYYKKALRLYEDCSISFYDSLILQAALDTGCQTLYTEDLQHGQKFGKLTVINPFL